MMSTMATSSIQSNNSSSYLAPPRTWNYDVFLSFRGQDTRRNFTDHLYHALTRAGIRTFRDDDQLPRGKHIPIQLMNAIEESRISIIVFSKNYASSRWCLNELVKVLECKNTRGQLVLPVFYDVDPSHVRKQTGSFEKAFAGYEEENEEGFGCEIKKWRAALTEAANLSGWDLQNVANGHESMFIEKIVEKVQVEVNQTYMNVAMHLVGMDSRVASINSLLSFESNSIRIVGIYGPGGIGKSTIAKAIYNQSYLLFEGSSFIANVKDVSEQPNGLVHIQEQILSETLKEKNFKIGNVDRGMVLMKEKLCSKRVLIVLDDVDKLSQVNAVAGQNDWFGFGSRIIITTRDEHLMHQAKVLRRYEAQKLNDYESLELFNLHAFETTPSYDYLELSKGIVAYAGGLPLALEVFGGYLVGRTKEQWESAFKKLQQIPHDQIQERLKISYDGLEDDVKGIFLDIACFFVGMDNILARIILNNCGFHAEIGISVLKDRCLLKVDEMNNTLIMHNLVRDMGREIVRKESPKEPGMRSRLWFHEDIHEVLQNDKGTEAIEGVSLVLSTSKETKIKSRSFARINKLRLLKINNVHVTGSLKHVSKQLRWLCWHHCPLKSLHSIFHMEKLVVLDMQHSKINTIWKGTKFLKSLKILNLSHSNFLEGTMDFNGVRMLEALLLEGCTSLLEVDSSVGVCVKLAQLNLKGCKKLKNLPDSICMLESLEYLNLIGCSNLDKLPEKIGLLKNLTSLYIDGCKPSEPVTYSRFSFIPPWLSLRRSPDSTSFSFIPSWLSLRRSPGSMSFSLVPSWLSLRRNPDSTSFSFVPSWLSLGRSPDSTRFLPYSISSFQSLTMLSARICNLSDGDIPIEIGSLSSLRTLDLGANIFSFLPDSLNLLSKLEQLVVDQCQSLKSLPKLPPNIKVVSMDGCISIERLPDLSNSKKSILFNLQKCGFVASHGMLKLSSVKRLTIYPHSILVRNCIDNLSQVHTEHVGLPGPRRKCSILLYTPQKKTDYFELKILAVYEAKKDGFVSTRVSWVLNPDKASCYQRKVCFSHFESQYCGNYYLVSRIPLRYHWYEIEGIEVFFEIAPSASIVVKMCQLQLLSRTPYSRGFSVDKIQRCKYGFDKVETCSGLANKDEDPKRLIMEDEDQMINNKSDTKYIHLFNDCVVDNFIIKIVNTAQVLEDLQLQGAYQQ